MDASGSRLMMDGLAHDELRGQLHGLLVSLSPRLAADDTGEISDLIDHDEFGEALRTLAWLIVEGGLRVESRNLDRVRRLAAEMDMTDELPDFATVHSVEGGAPATSSAADSGGLLRWRNWALARVLEASIGQIPREVIRVGACLHESDHDAELYVEVGSAAPTVEQSVAIILSRLESTVGRFGHVTALIDDAMNGSIDLRVEGTDFQILFGGFAAAHGHSAIAPRPVPVRRVISRPALPHALRATDHWVDQVAVHAATTSAGYLPSSPSDVGLSVGIDSARYHLWRAEGSASDHDQMDRVVDLFDDGVVPLATVDWTLEPSGSSLIDSPRYRWLYRSPSGSH